MQSIQSIVRKGRDLSRLNDWRNPEFVIPEKSVISPEDWGQTFFVILLLKAYQQDFYSLVIKKRFLMQKSIYLCYRIDLKWVRTAILTLLFYTFSPNVYHHTTVALTDKRKFRDDWTNPRHMLCVPTAIYFSKTSDPKDSSTYLAENKSRIKIPRRFPQAQRGSWFRLTCSTL